MFEELIDELLRTGLATKRDIQGCADEEIASLEAAYGALPNAYLKFLLELGNGAGEFMQGTDVFYRSLRGLKEDAIELLKENEEEFDFPEDAFVFSMHQGYEFLYFRLSDGDDPGIYQYVEGQGTPQKVWSSFTEFIHDALMLHVQHK